MDQRKQPRAHRALAIAMMPFLPAIAVMDRLSFARKFVFIGLLLSGPVAVVVYFQASIETHSIEFNERERIGVAYVRTAGELLHRLQRLRILAAAGGETSRQESAAREVDGAMAAVEEADLAHGDILRTRDSWRTQRALLLAARTDGATLPRVAATVSGVLTDLLLQHAANYSNLILDPDLDSYWLMDAYALMLPALSEAVTRSTLAALTVPSRESAAVILAAHDDELAMAAKLAERDFETAFRETPRYGRREGLRAALAPALDVARAAVREHAASLRRGADVPRNQQPNARLGLGEQALQTVDRLWILHGRVGPELDRFVAARVARHRDRRLRGLLAAAGAAAALAYLFVAVSMSVRRSMQVLRAPDSVEASSVKVASKDELGEMATALTHVRRQQLRLEEQLRLADKLSTLGLLAAGTAHELNEPLGAILGFAQLARKSSQLPLDAMRDIDKIEKAALHAREVIRKLMLFARQTPPRKEHIDLKKIVAEALELLRPRCEQDAVAVDAALPAGACEVVADASQLRQAVLNLLVNAIQATARGGVILVRLEPGAAQHRLTIEDHGTGMSEDVRQRLFLPFFTTKDVGQGTGLGLSVVHGIVSAHGGTVQVESSPGAGARFDVLLPRATP